MAPAREDLQRAAESTFGWSELRDEQLVAMEHVVAGRDVLATVVVSPLIALQHDQREAEGLGNQERVEHPTFGEGMIMSTEDDRVTVLFAEHGYKTLALDAVRERALLEPASRD